MTEAEYRQRLVAVRPVQLLQIDYRLRPEIWKDGCLSHCYQRIANPTLDPAEALRRYQHWVDAQWMRANCYCRQPDKMLASIGFKATTYVRVEQPGYVAKPNEHLILQWRRPGFEHYTCEDFDPEGYSRTVIEGHIVAVVVCTGTPA